MIGGGTGTYTVLLGLKQYPVDLSVVVSMMDSGGSNRILRDEFGLLPTSDIRQCIVALSSEDSDQTLRKLFTYRYSAGTGISGMTFGNLFMAALTDIYHGDQRKAINETCELLGVKGGIVPVTYDISHLVARYSTGKQVLGEHAIDEPSDDCANHRIVELEVFPPAKASPDAIGLVMRSEVIVLGPGDLYTSILPNLIVGGVAEALRQSKALKVLVINLMTRHGQTDDFSAKDHLREVERYIGDGVVDVCLVNKSRAFPPGVLRRYKQEHAHPVKDDFTSEDKIRVIRGEFVSRRVFEREKGDSLHRSLIRHDPAKLAKAIISL